MAALVKMDTPARDGLTAAAIQSRRYRVYGLELETRQILPVANGTSGLPALDLTFAGEQPPLAVAPAVQTHTIERDAGITRLRLEDADGGWSDYRSGDGRWRIATTLDWAASLPILLGLAARVVLHQRAIPVLHGAALAIDGRAVLLLGDSGAGKSTLAAGLMARGMGLLSEDVIVLSPCADGLAVEPGHAHLSLDKRTASAVAPFALTGAQLRYGDKLWLSAEDFPGGFCTRAARVDAIYLLSEGPMDEPPALVPLEPRLACHRLLGALHRHAALDLPLAEALRQFAHLAATAPVYRLLRAWTPAAIDDIAGLVWHNFTG